MVPDSAINLDIQTNDPQDFEILSWCPAGPVLPQGEKVPL